MSEFIRIFQGIPVWAYLLLAVLIWSGMRATVSRVASLVLIVAPLIFVLWGMRFLVVAAGASGLPIVAWAIAGALGIATAYGLRKVDPLLERRAGSIFISGSWLPLARNILIFSAKFATTFMTIVNPTPAAFIADAAVSGLAAGYSAAWLALILRSYLGLKTARDSRP